MKTGERHSTSPLYSIVRSPPSRSSLVLSPSRTSYEDSATDSRVSMGSQPTSQILRNSGFGFVPPPLRARHAPSSMMSRFGTSTDFAEVNARYRTVLGVEPVPVAEFARLHDLAIIRHTVAHHGSVIRQIDVPRFQYYSVTPGALINPPPAFVRETSNYLYQIGAGFELAVRNHVFTRVIASLAPDWSKPPPQLLVDLIEAFDYFGILFRRMTFHRSIVRCP